MFGRKRRGKDLEGWLEELDRNEDRFEAAWADMLADRSPATTTNVDMTLILAQDPGFDGHAFLAIARESYFQMREAWEQRDARIARGVATRPIMTELEVAISDDVAAGRKHLLPGVEINSAVITSASVEFGKLHVIVRMHLIGKEHYVDETTHAIVEGDDEYHHWDEEWTFEHVQGVDDPAEDREHALLPEARGGWDFAHRGWNVAGIKRLGAPTLS
jgi:predicted lipid-binding transport protein (Tim44 family)